ncbi:MAG: hypothetical protein HY782_24190 [Chloroflexi bacterium]|nr:hypothetical protein [Chloroflexota bacterium]
MRKFVAFLLVLLFVITLPLALLSYNIGRVVFDGALVKRVATKEVTESDLIAIIVRWFAQRRAQERVLTGEAQTAIREPDALKALEFPTNEDWRKIKAEVLPNEFLTTWVAVAVDGLYSWIDTKDPLPQITFELKPWKDYNRSQHGWNAIQVVYNSLPPCKQPDIDDFLKRLAAVPPGQEVLYNLYTPCMFPDPWRPDQNQDYLDSRNEILDSAADRFFLTQELSRIEKQSGVGAESIKQQLILIRTAAAWSLLVPLIFVALMFLLALRSRMDWARWLGIPILVGGLLSLLPALVYQTIVNALLTMGPMSEVPREVQTEFARAFGVLLAEVFSPMLIESLVIMVIGLAIVIAGSVRKPKVAAQPAPAG